MFSLLFLLVAPSLAVEKQDFKARDVKFPTQKIAHLEPVTHVSVQHLPHTPSKKNGLDRPHPDKLQLHVHMYGNKHAFALNVAEWLFEPNSFAEFHKADGTTERVPNSMRGYHADTETGWIAATLHPNFVSALIAHNGKLYQMEPLSRHSADMEDHHLANIAEASDFSGYVVYDIEDSGEHVGAYCGSIVPPRPEEEEDETESEIETEAATDKSTLGELNIGNVVKDAANYDPASRSLLAVGLWDGCWTGQPAPPQSGKLKLGIAADHLFTKRFANLGQAQDALGEMMLKTSMLYRQQPNVVVSVEEIIIYEAATGSPTWNTYSNSASGCSQASINQALSDFGSWRLASRPTVGGLWALVSGCDWFSATGGTVGLAYVGTICSKNSGCSANQWAGPNSWLTVAHEIGHNFGARHSFEEGQGSTGGIMDYGDGLYLGEYQFNSQYRRSEMCAAIETSKSRCGAYNSYTSCAVCWGTFTPSCGNGILEEGEECDDPSSCCDQSTCTLYLGNQCSNDECCDSSTCRYLPSTYTCGYDGASGYCSNGACDTTAPSCDYGIGWRFCGMVNTGCTYKCHSDGAKCSSCTSGNGGYSSAHWRDKCGEGTQASRPLCYKTCDTWPKSGVVAAGTVCGTYDGAGHQQVCSGSSCVTPTPSCSDGIFNGDEEKTDCGGSCPTSCSATCAPGTENCDTSNSDCETNIYTSNIHCGACSAACPAFSQCNVGTCSCLAGRENCETANPDCETELASTNAHCGACGVSCGANSDCVNSNCVCRSGFGSCNGLPTDGDGCETYLQTSTTNCGVCGRSCPVCVGGSCASCTAPMADCGSNSCDINTENDNNNCGGCGVVCGANSQCVNSACQCNANMQDCTGASGCETDVRSSNSHCGACNMACGANSVCTSGACQCLADTGDCNNDRTAGSGGNGCETDTVTNPAHCGTCGVACGTQAHCSASTCACNAGYLNCDASMANGCEVTLATDLAHCGTCNNACAANMVCSSGRCLCAANRGDCDGNAGNGCEVDLSSTSNFCGDCDIACPLHSSCVNSVCVCDANYGDCDSDLLAQGPSNGCETDLRTTTAHCSACGSDCGASSTCTGGTCGCVNPFKDCNGQQSDGCEVDTTSDAGHCGACHVACPFGKACSDGNCVCPVDYANCETSSPDCETNLKSDAANCGACGVECLSTCSNGVCGGCVGTALNCDGDVSNSCEVDPLTDNNNCGACGTVCGAHQTCQAGTCTCDADWGDCNGDPTDGCEADLYSLDTCTACNTQCEANQICNNGCQCKPGWDDCTAADGCETWLQDDPNNCGQCGIICDTAASESCQGGRCTCVIGMGACDSAVCNDEFFSSNDHCGECNNSCGPGFGGQSSCLGGVCSCHPAFGNCDNDWTNGCEMSLSDDNNNCGGCGAACHLATQTCIGQQCVCAEGRYNCDKTHSNGCEETSPCVSGPPTLSPTATPTTSPTTAMPTDAPTTAAPTVEGTTRSPTSPPTVAPTDVPTTSTPTAPTAPTEPTLPTEAPSQQPSAVPTAAPTTTAPSDPPTSTSPSDPPTSDDLGLGGGSPTPVGAGGMAEPLGLPIWVWGVVGGTVLLVIAGIIVAVCIIRAKKEKLDKARMTIGAGGPLQMGDLPAPQGGTNVPGSW